MPVLRGRFRELALALLCATAQSCGRVGYNLMAGTDVALDSSAGAVVGSGGAGVVATGSGGSAGATETGAGALSTGSGAGGRVLGAGGSAPGAGGNGGTISAGGAPGAGGAAGGITASDAGNAQAGAGGAPVGDASGPGQPPLDCSGGRALGELWTFATGVDSWYFAPSAAVAGSMTRVLAPGDLDPGALLVDITAVGTDSRSWVETNSPQPNLGGHTAHAAIWLDSDVTAWTKLFALSGVAGVWMDGGTLVLAPHAWTCFELVFDAPDYVSGTADVTNVTRLGLELSGTEPFRVYIDDIGY